MNRKYPHFAIPEIYGDSLSYYELLRKLVEAMNAVIENYDTIPDQIAEAVANLDASQLFSEVLKQLIESIATDNTKSANAVKVYKKHDLLYATFNETVNLYESLIDFSTGTATELIPGTNIREVNISELFIELRKLIDYNKKDYITPQMFGAIGDGVTNDSPAFQKAINYALKNNCLEIFVPSGKYLLKDTLYSYPTDEDYHETHTGTLQFRGSVRQFEAAYKTGSVLICASNTPTFMVHLDKDGKKDTGQMPAFTISNISFVGTDPNKSVAIKQWCNRIKINNCAFYNLLACVQSEENTTDPADGTNYTDDAIIEDCALYGIKGTAFTLRVGDISKISNITADYLGGARLLYLYGGHGVLVENVIANDRTLIETSEKDFITTVGSGIIINNLYVEGSASHDNILNLTYGTQAYINNMTVKYNVSKNIINLIDSDLMLFNSRFICDLKENGNDIDTSTGINTIKINNLLTHTSSLTTNVDRNITIRGTNTSCKYLSDDIKRITVKYDSNSSNFIVIKNNEWADEKTDIYGTPYIDGQVIRFPWTVDHGYGAKSNYLLWKTSIINTLNDNYKITKTNENAIKVFNATNNERITDLNSILSDIKFEISFI